MERREEGIRLIADEEEQVRNLLILTGESYATEDEYPIISPTYIQRISDMEWEPSQEQEEEGIMRSREWIRMV